MPKDQLVFWGVHRNEMAPFLKGGMRSPAEFPNFDYFEKAFGTRMILQQLQDSTVCFFYYENSLESFMPTKVKIRSLVGCVIRVI